jgi:ELWxxDGT repeat protein
VTQYLFFLDANADSGGNSLLWTSSGASATKTSVSFNPYAGNNLIVLPAIAPVNKPLSRHGIDAGILLFGNDSAGSDNLFFWDGISAPTEVSGGSNAPSNGLIPQCLTAYSGAVYFNGQTNSGNDLWSSDGTTANTNLLTTSNYNPLYLATAFGQLFFNGNGNLYSCGPDGVVGDPITTGFNPYCLAALEVGSAPHYFGPVFNPVTGAVSIPGPPALPVSLFMGGTDDGGNARLYRYGGEGSAPQSIDTTSDGLNPYNLVALQWGSAWEIPYHIPGFPELKDLFLFYWNSAVFFSGFDGFNNGNPSSPLRGLWMSDGTAATTVNVQGSWVSGVSLDPYNLTPLNGILYFTGADDAVGTGRGLFSYDPVKKQTTHIFKSTAFDFSPQYTSSWNGSPPGGQGNASPFTMTAFDNKLYFNCIPANRTIGVQGLYVWDPADGPEVNPTPVTGAGGSNPFCLMVVDFP